MPCCLFSALMGLPRLALMWLLIFTNYLGEAFAAAGKPHFLIFVGLVFLPWTTLAYAWLIHRTGGHFEAWSWILLAFAFLSDMGAVKRSRRVETY
jgi:hypothetical protein